MADNIKFDLAAFRTKHGFSQQQLADVLGVSKVQVWRLERDGAVPKIYLWAFKGIEGYKEQQCAALG